jgi:hypothetical protein
LPDDDPLPASAGSGGGRGTAELGCAADVFGDDEVALGEAAAVADVVGDDVPDVVVPDVVGDVLVLGVVVFVVPVVAVAGDCGELKSDQDSVRMVLPPALTVSDVAVTV